MHKILKTYIPIADIIAGIYGNNCEVVIHDLSNPVSSVVYVVNGHITGRKVGQSFNHLVKDVLLNKNFKNDRLSNYVFKSTNNRKIKSASALIRDEEDKIIGMLCINCDITCYDLLQTQLNSILSFEEEKMEDELTQDVLAIIDEIILKIIGEKDIKNLTRKESIEIVSFMNEKGIFLVKGAIEKVAFLMGVSKVTIYSYLDEAKGKR